MHLRSVLILFFLICVGHAGLALSESSAPNFVFILVDDQGWNGLSVPMDPGNVLSGSSYFRTPNLERLAGEGMRFSRAYAPAPTCSPSRHAIQWGRSPTSLGIFGADNIKGDSLEPSAALPHRIKAANSDYVCAHMGKWHIALTGQELGFDVVATGDGHDLNDANYKGRHNPDSSDPRDPKYIFSLTRQANEFIEEQVNAGRPFFLQISHYADHLSYQALPETIEKYKTQYAGNATEYHHDPVWAAMNEDLDTAIGMVLDKIQALDIAGNTYVIYTSDNGFEDKYDFGLAVVDRGFFKAFPLRSHKYTVSEGGIRVPFIVRGPGIQAGTHSAVPVVGTDIYPTIMAILSETRRIPEEVEGANLLPHLTSAGQDNIERRDPFLVFKYTKPRKPHDIAIIQGDYKLIKDVSVTGEIYLYNLHDDPGEQNNIAEREPDRAKQMYEEMTAYFARYGWDESMIKGKRDN